MKLKGEVFKQLSDGERIEVSITNVRAVRDADWQEYQPSISFKVSQNAAKAFPIGCVVSVTIKRSGRKP